MNIYSKSDRPIFHYITQPDQLRIGILLLSKQQPDWVSIIITRVKELSFAELVLVIVGGVDHDVAQIRLRTRNSRLEKYFFNVDQTPSQSIDRILEDTETNQWLDTSQLLEIRPVMNKNILHLPGSDIHKICEARLDLIFLFGLCQIEQELIVSARYGVWSYCSQFKQWQIPDRVVEVLFSLYEHGAIALTKDPYTSTVSPQKSRTSITISKRELMLILLKEWKCKIEEVLWGFMHYPEWEIAVQFNTSQLLENILTQPIYRLQTKNHQLKGDPFPVEEGGRYFLFYEERNNHGPGIHLPAHISVVEMDFQKALVSKSQIVIERKYHLSYPFVFRWEKSYYMIPETRQNRSVELYRCVSFPNQWELCKVLMDDISLVDVTLFEKDNLWWMFASIPLTNPKNANYLKSSYRYSLLLFYAETPLGPWYPHPQNPIKTNSRSTRSAGRLFYHQGKLIRPSQDCSPRYGYGVIFNIIDELTIEKFHETEYSKLVPVRKKDILGIHTFNIQNNMTFLDIQRWRNKFFDQLFIPR